MTKKAKVEDEYLEQYDYVVEEDFFYNSIEIYAPLIGKFFMIFSSLERELNEIIADYISNRSHDLGYIIISNMIISKKIELFDKLYSILSNFNEEKTSNELKTLVSKLKTINSFRNNLANADWGTLKKNGIVRVKIQTENQTGLVKFKNIKIKPKNIRENIDKIDLLVERLKSYKEEAFSF
jgi:hypothetical protein